MINKRGSLYGVIGIVSGVMLILAFIFMFVLGGVIVKDNFGVIAEEIRDIGVIYDGVNVSESANYVLNPLESIINNYALFATIIYILGIVSLFSLAFMFRGNLNGLVVVLFIMAALLVIVFSILISNGYEVLYSGNDFIGEGLREAGIINYLILYSPMIMTIVTFIAGIILFTGKDGNY
jgi:hypothetical protein